METLAIFQDVESAGRAVKDLIRLGFVESQITSYSSVAYPEGTLSKVKGHGWFRLVTVASALVGLMAGFGLAAGTAWLYPVRTGDKPIISLFPAAIVTFEVTMLFAIIGTMVGMFLEMKLPNFKRRLYDPAIADGYIGIGLIYHAPGQVVVCGRGPDSEPCIGAISALPVTEQRARADEALMKAGALRTITE
jgi:hypothetical protein